MRNEIVLEVTAKGLTATFYGPKASEITDLFGSNVLPLANVAIMGDDSNRGTAQGVIQYMRKNWPSFAVEFI